MACGLFTVQFQYIVQPNLFISDMILSYLILKLVNFFFLVTHSSLQLRPDSWFSCTLPRSVSTVNLFLRNNIFVHLLCILDRQHPLYYYTRDISGAKSHIYILCQYHIIATTCCWINSILKLFVNCVRVFHICTRIVAKDCTCNVTHVFVSACGKCYKVLNNMFFKAIAGLLPQITACNCIYMQIQIYLCLE